METTNHRVIQTVSLGAQRIGIKVQFSHAGESDIEERFHSKFKQSGSSE